MAQYCIGATGNGTGGVAGGGGTGLSPSEVASGAGATHDGGIPVIRVTTNMVTSLDIQLTKDIAGGIPAEFPEGSTVWFKAKQLLTDQTPFILKQCAIKDASTGLLELFLTKKETKDCGTWVGGFMVKDANDNLIQEYFCYYQVDLGMDGLVNSTSSNGLSIGMIRMALLDYSRDANVLLNDLEFSDVMVTSAIMRPVNDWNATPPDLGRYTACTFPWTEPWLRCTCGYLLEMAAAKYVRNALPHNAGGLTMDPNNKGNAYLQMAERLRSEWKNWVAAKKTELNMMSVWGGTANIAFDGTWKYRGLYY